MQVSKSGSDSEEAEEATEKSAERSEVSHFVVLWSFLQHVMNLCSVVSIASSQTYIFIQAFIIIYCTNYLLTGKGKLILWQA